jgi:hypothetical protein
VEAADGGARESRVSAGTDENEVEVKKLKRSFPRRSLEGSRSSHDATQCSLQKLPSTCVPFYRRLVASLVIGNGKRRSHFASNKHGLHGLRTGRLYLTAGLRLTVTVNSLTDHRTWYNLQV